MFHLEEEWPMDRKTVRINPNGSKEEVPWTKLKVGDLIEKNISARKPKPKKPVSKKPLTVHEV